MCNFNTQIHQKILAMMALIISRIGLLSIILLALNIIF